MIGLVNALSYYNVVLSTLFLRNLQKLFFLAVACLKKKTTKHHHQTKTTKNHKLVTSLTQLTDYNI